MIADLLLSVFGGGATGLFGSVLGRFLSIWETRQERKFVLEKYKLDAQVRAQETARELQIIDAKVAGEALSASYKHDSKITVTSSFVKSIRVLVRPVLTGFLWVLVGAIWFTLPEGGEYRSEIIQSILYASTTATVWWFGDRGHQKKI